MFFKSQVLRPIIPLLLLLAATSLLTGCSQKEEAYTIAVFIPGVTEGSPTYKMLADGVLEAAATSEEARASVIEGGFNQGEWLEKVKALAASGEWDLIVTSNPALPRICDAVSKEFPSQKFLILDGYLEGNSSIYTLRYHQMEQGYLAGTMAGLVTGSGMEGASPALSVGMVVGQEFPDMNLAIRPGFETGVATTAPGAKTAFRVVGNWFDAAKASELAGDLYDSGADVILTIAGGANQGVISAARERGRYVIWFDTSGYDLAPGIVIGSTAIHQQKAAYEKTLLAIEGNLPFGAAEVATAAGGWISFVEDDPLYLEHVPKAIRQRQSAILQDLKEGKPALPLTAE